MAEGEPSRISQENTSAKQKCLRTDYKLCIKCQHVTNEALVQPKTESYVKFLECVHFRAKYDGKDYPSLSKRLADDTSDSLAGECGKWHTSCYKAVTHKTTLERAKKAYESGLIQQDVSVITSRKCGRPSLATVKTEIPSTSKYEESGERYLLRSSGEKLEKHLCFFCNQEAHEASLGPLHQVSNVTSTADKASVGQTIYTTLCDTCGRFQGKGKLTCWNTLLRAPKKIRDAFAQLGKTPDLPLESSIIHALEEFVCLLYRQKGSKSIDLPNLRWELFTASQVEARTEAATYKSSTPTTHSSGCLSVSCVGSSGRS